MAVDYLTLSGARDAVLEQINDVSGSRQVSNAYLNRIINQAQRIIARRSESLLKTATQALTASIAGYTLPAEWLKTRTVQFISSGGERRELKFMQFGDYAAIRVVTTTSWPTHYTIDETAGELVVIMTPSGTGDSVRHVYIKQPQALVLDSDVLFDNDIRLYAWHDLVILVSVNLVLAKERKLTPHVAVQELYQEIEEMKRSLGATKSGGFVEAGSFSGGRSRFLAFPSGYPRV